MHHISVNDRSRQENTLHLKDQSTSTYFNSTKARFNYHDENRERAAIPGPGAYEVNNQGPKNTQTPFKNQAGRKDTTHSFLGAPNTSLGPGEYATRQAFLKKTYN